MFGWARRRIGVQLVLAMVFVSLAPLLGAGALLLRQTESSLRSQVEAHQVQMSQLSANLIRDYLRDATTKLEIIAHFVAARKYEDPELLTKDLGQRLDSAGIFLDLNYYQLEADRNFYANTQQRAFNEGQTLMQGGNNLDPAINPSILKESFVVEAKGGRVFVSPRLEDLSGIPYVVISVPVLRKESVRAVLAAHVDFRPVNQMLQHVAGQGRVIEVTSGGKTVAASGSAPAGPLIETAGPVGHSDWRVVVSESKSTAFETLRRARSQSLIWLICAAALAFGLSALIGARILRPVRALTRTAQEVGQGNLTVRTGIHRTDELGVLAAQFDRMTESLQELDRLKSDFVSHVSHELRTPLTSAKLSLANLQDEVVGPMAPKQKEVVARIRQDMDRLIHMVNELLDIARLEAGKVELAREPLDLASILIAAMDTVRPLAAEKGVTLSAEGGATVQGDRAKLVRVFLNLLDNAVKFTPSGGSVRAVVSGGEVAIEDTGPGLPDDATRMFEKFAPRKQPGTPGVGLGLSIARKLVELHGGSIRAENRPGGGARFVVRFA